MRDLVTTNETSIPAELKNQLYRNIWKNLTHSRNLIEKREEERKSKLLLDEKLRLGLPDDENILLIGEGGSKITKTVLLLSLGVLAVSALASDMVSGGAAFLIMSTGLLGVVFAIGTERRTKYYFSNYRVLKSKRSVFSSQPKWNAIHYHEVTRISEESFLGNRRIALTGDKETPSLLMTGLGKELACRVMAILDTSSGWAPPPESEIINGYEVS